VYRRHPSRGADEDTLNRTERRLMKRLRRLALWIAVNIPLGKLSPHLLGFGLNARYFRDEPR